MEGNSPRGEEGERELKEDEVDMLLLLLRSPLPSSDRPEPGRDLVDISRFGFSAHCF